MIAAIEQADDPDVYVFADSDIKPSRNWLNELIRPLARDDITVVSGFRWLYSSTGKMGEITNAYQNAMLYVLFTFASFVNDIGLWGGSMAIKKKEFDELGVKDYWKHTVVDDNSLSRLIMKNSKKSVMVSTCVTPTDDALKTIRQSINWFERQVMFFKAYQKPLWYAAILLVTTCLILQLLLPVSLVLSYYTDTTFLEAGGAATLFFFIGTMFCTLLFPFLGRQPTFFRFLFYQPVSLYSVLYGAFKTLFTNTVKWSGFHYKLNYSGKVISVEQQQ
jgi:cellulose synthase/poly-beta-1,6-N-acetylglucosamine synthase-like glycosyltransferase